MNKIRLQVPTFNREEIKSSLEVLDSTMVVMGEKTKAFEKKWGEWQGIEFNTMVNSGSSANLLLINLLLSKHNKNRIEPGDEILVPAVTWSTTLFPVIQLGLKPILVDVKENTFNIDIESCKKALTKKTKAVFAVHLLGNPCNINELNNFCQENNLLLLEDCCESPGATWENEKVGNFGKASSFSFMFAHHISTIEGGMISLKDANDDHIMKASRAHGWIREIPENKKQEIIDEYQMDNVRFLFWDIGFNLRPQEISAVFGIHQLDKINRFIETRNNNFKRYIYNLNTIFDKIQIQELEDNEKAKRSNFAFGFYIKDTDQYNRKKLFNYLEEQNIESRPLVAGNLARHPFYPLYCEPPKVNLGTADQIHDGGLYLPNHQDLSLKDIDYISEHLIKFFN